MSSNILIRKVILSDNDKLAKIIRIVLKEYGGDKPGTAYFDYDTDHMFEADFIDGEWKDLQIKPIENLSLHPANLTLHYGQTIFEGMKAFLTKDNKPILFRPEEHAKRFNRSAARMSMPSIPENLFIKAILVFGLVDTGSIISKFLLVLMISNISLYDSIL